jgi:hypothetical protein
MKIQKKNDNRWWCGTLLILADMAFGTGLAYLAAYLLISYQIPYMNSVIMLLVTLVMYYFIDKGLNTNILKDRLKILLKSGVFCLSWILIIEKGLNWSESIRLYIFISGFVVVLAYYIFRGRFQKTIK